MMVRDDTTLHFYALLLQLVRCCRSGFIKSILCLRDQQRHLIDI